MVQLERTNQRLYQQVHQYLSKTNSTLLQGLVISLLRMLTMVEERSQQELNLLVNQLKQ